MLKEHGLVGLPMLPRKLDNARVCLQGKHHKQPFQESNWLGKRKLELIHLDLCGSMAIISVGGNKCIKTLIDDLHQNDMDFFFLKNSEAF